MSTTEQITAPILIISAKSFLNKYFAAEAAARYKKPEESVEIVNDLNSSSIEASIKESAERGCKNVVMISSTEVYGCYEGENITEEFEIDSIESTLNSYLKAEAIAKSNCDALGLNLTILRCAEIIGTGMDGQIMQLVKTIYRGTYHHITDETARMSVVHAVDVARATFDMAGVAGTFNLTDGVDPTVRDLAEAIAYRLDHKRIFTLSVKKARTIARVGDYFPFIGFDSKKLKARYRTLTFSSEKLRSQLSWQPNSVTEYLRTHAYNDQSL